MVVGTLIAVFDFHWSKTPFIFIDPTKTPKRVTWKGKRLYAYQLLCVALQGVLPRRDEVVRHRCHNRRCINPEHLQLGTQQDNIHDERVRQYR